MASSTTTTTTPFSGVQIPGTIGSTNDPYGLGQIGQRSLDAGAIFGIPGAVGKMTADQAYEYWRMAPASSIAGIQQALYMSGQYPANYVPHWGVQSQQDDELFKFMLKSAALAGPGSSLNQILADAASAGQNTGMKAVVVPGQVGGFNAYTQTATDPAALRLLADEVGHNILGRKPDAAERDRIVATISKSQYGQDAKANSARESQAQAQYGASTAQAATNASAQTGQAPAVDAAGLNSDFGGRLDALVAASGGRLHIVSGHRTNAQQQALWDKSDKTGKTVARPGTSNHEKGLAADLGGDLAWAHANAAKFGLNFPMSYEAWHIEPANVKALAAGAVTQVPGTYGAPTTVSTITVNPAAQAEEALRAAHPSEAAAHDSTSVYASMLKLAQGAG